MRRLFDTFDKAVAFVNDVSDSTVPFTDLTERYITCQYNDDDSFHFSNRSLINGEPCEGVWIIGITCTNKTAFLGWLKEHAKSSQSLHPLDWVYEASLAEDYIRIQLQSQHDEDWTEYEAKAKRSKGFAALWGYKDPHGPSEIITEVATPRSARALKAAHKWALANGYIDTNVEYYSVSRRGDIFKGSPYESIT